MENLAYYANIASLLGLGLTLLILNSIRKLRKRFLSKARIPSLLKTLNDQVSNIINNVSNDPIDLDGTRTELKKVVSNIKNISKKLPIKLRIDCFDLNWMINRALNKDQLSKEIVMDLYSEIAGCIETFKNYLNDLEWS